MARNQIRAVLDPCQARQVKKRRRSADLVKLNVVPAVRGARSFPLGTRTTLLVALLCLTAGLWLWMVFRLDAIVAVKLAKLWHLPIA
jgi:hypothetical protein